MYPAGFRVNIESYNPDLICTLVSVKMNIFLLCIDCKQWPFMIILIEKLFIYFLCLCVCNPSSLFQYRILISAWPDKKKVKSEYCFY